MFRQGLEILRSGDEMAFVACTGDASQTHALEAMVGLEVRKAHLNLLALIARFVELRGSHQRASLVGALSLRSRGILRCKVFGQHLGLIGHELQLRKLVR